MRVFGRSKDRAGLDDLAVGMKDSGLASQYNGAYRVRIGSIAQGFEDDNEAQPRSTSNLFLTHKAIISG